MVNDQLIQPASRIWAAIRSHGEVVELAIHCSEEMMASEMNPTINPYSIIVAPLESRARRVVNAAIRIAGFQVGWSAAGPVAGRC